MANTFTLIASSTVGAGGAATITFSSIPSTYTDLVLKVSARNTTSVERELWINPNGSTANGSGRALWGNGSTTGSYSPTRFEAFGYIAGTGMTASTFSSVDVYIPNYTASTNKSLSGDGVTENNATLGYNALNAGLWSNTAAITSLDLVLAGGVNFAQHSTAYLYGVKNA